MLKFFLQHHIKRVDKTIFGELLEVLVIRLKVPELAYLKAGLRIRVELTRIQIRMRTIENTIF